MLFPEWKRDPGFDVVNDLIDASSGVYLRSSLSSTPDAVKPRLLTTPFSTTAFVRSTVWRFEASSCKAASKDLPSSHVQHGASAPSWHNIPLGPCPSLHRLRRGWGRIVRRLLPVNATDIRPDRYYFRV
jgi:hypothetical protein